MSIPLVIAEFTGRYERMLRRFTFSTDKGPECPGYEYGHDASVITGTVGEDEHERVHGDNWPHDDDRWPAACERCGREFADGDQWQRNDNRIFRLPDGTEFPMWGSFGRNAPPGTMVRADWHDAYSRHPGGAESWIISLPGGHEWVSTQRASDGGYWTVSGTAPLLTVTPSILCTGTNGWHGFVTNGELVDA
jgi:hypothetical protein